MKDAQPIRPSPCPNSPPYREPCPSRSVPSRSDPRTTDGMNSSQFQQRRCPSESIPVTSRGWPGPSPVRAENPSAQPAQAPTTSHASGAAPACAPAERQSLVVSFARHVATLPSPAHPKAPHASPVVGPSAMTAASYSSGVRDACRPRAPRPPPPGGELRQRRRWRPRPTRRCTATSNRLSAWCPPRDGQAGIAGRRRGRDNRRPSRPRTRATGHRS